MNTSELRKLKHLSARREMEKGQFSSALFMLKEIEDQLGEHIFITLDLAACYYMLHDYFIFEKLAQKGLKTFNDQNDNLEEKTFILSANALGKYLEELGDLIQAERMYQFASDKILTENIQLTAQIHAQRLRLKSFLGDENRLAEDYLICQTALNGFLHEKVTSVHFELHHALMLAEHSLQNSSAAENRVKKILPLLSQDHEKRLLLVDHLVEKLNSCGTLGDMLSQDIEGLQKISYWEADPYERAFFELIESRKVDLTELHKMSRQGRFRYLLLLMKLAEELNLDKSILENQFSLVLKNFKPDCHSLLRKRWKIMETQSLQVRFDQTHVVLLKGPFQVRFSKLSLPGRLIELASKYPPQTLIPIETVINEVYGESLSLCGFEKVRQLIIRLNRQLKDQLTIEKYFSVSNAGFTQLLSTTLVSRA